MAELTTDAEKWIARIRRVEKINKPKRDEALRFMKAYMGDFQNRKGEEASKNNVRINFIYYFIETIMASIFSGEPKVRGRAKRGPELQKAAELLAYNTNYWAKELDARSEFLDAAFYSFFGPSAIYTGWEFETDEAGKVLKDQPLIRFLNYWEELRVDPDVLRTRRARWMAMRVTVPHQEFLETQTIKEEYRVGPKALKATQRPEDLAEDNAYKQDKNHVPSDAEWVTYWEVWDREKRKRIYVHDECPEILNAGSTDWPFQIEVKNDEFPITILHAKQDPFGPTSFSELKPIEDQIWERVRLRSVQAAIARRMAPKYLYQKGAGTKDQINKLLKSDILSGNELNDINKFQLMPTPQIPPDFYNWDNVLAEDLGNVSGLSEFQNNQLANTATEASIAEGRATVRKSERTMRLEQFVVTVLSKLAQLCQQLQMRETVFAVNPVNLAEAEPQVFHVTKDQIQVEAELELVAGTLEWVNTESMKRDLLKFLEIAAQSGEANVPVILSKVAELLDLDPRDVLLSQETKDAMAASGKEPAIKFAPLKAEDLSPVDRLRVVEKAKEEAGVSSLSPGPAQAAQGALASLEQFKKPTLHENASMNLAGNPEPNSPVHPASLGGER